jgi:nitrogen fixation NifU-like protein
VAAWAPEGGASQLHGEHSHQPQPADAVDQRLLDHAANPRNLGDMADPSGVATGVGVCGDSMEVAIRVKGERIGDIRVRPKGCLYTIACASAMSQMAQGRTLEKALALEPEDVDRKLGGLPEDHLHCARLAVNALGEAVEDYYRRLARSAREKMP